MWQEITEKVTECDDSNLDIHLRFFVSASGCKGHNLLTTEENFSVGHLFRSAVERIAEVYREIENAMTSTDVVDTLLLLSGLPTRFLTLREAIHRKFFGKTILDFEGEHVSPEGLAKTAMRLNA